MKNKFKNRRILSFLTAFVMMISIFANNTYSFADNYSTTETNYGIVKVVKVDGKEIQVNSDQDIAKYNEEYNKKMEEIKKQGYVIISSTPPKVTKKTILSNSTSEQGNAGADENGQGGKYILDGQEWEFNGNEAASYGWASAPTSLMKLKNTVTGETISAYCIDLFTAVGKSQKYNNEYLENLNYSSAIKANSDKLRSIIANSYPNKSLEQVRAMTGISDLSAQEAVRATQMLIWKTVHSFDIYDKFYNSYYKRDVGPGSNNVLNRKTGEVTNLFMLAGGTSDWTSWDNIYQKGIRIYKAIQAIDNQPMISELTNLAEPTLDVNNLKVTKVEDKTYHISYDYKVTGLNSSGSKVEANPKYYVDGKEIQLSKVSKSQNNDVVHIEGDFVSDVADNLQVKVKLLAMQSLNITNALLSTTNNENDSQTLITTKSTKNNRTVVAEAVTTIVSNSKAYSIALMKVDSSKLSSGQEVATGLKDAKFTLKDVNGNTIQGQATTDYNGKVVFANLKPGVYTLTEDVAPNGYKKLSGDVKITVENDGTIRALVDGTLYSSSNLLIPIPNTKKEVEKINLTAKKVWVGVDKADSYKATVYLVKDGVAVEEKVITGNGTVTFANLEKFNANNEPIKYEIKEKDIDGFTSKLAVNADKTVYTFTNTNDFGELDFNKTDLSKTKAVEGAKIEFYKEGESTPFLTSYTDKDGRISRQKSVGDATLVKENGNITLKVGKYYFKETEAPKGYILNKEAHYFEVKAGEVVKDTLTNELIGKTTVQAKKNWVNVDPAKLSTYSATFELFMTVDGEAEKTTGQKQTVKGNAEVKFANLDTKTADGKSISYTIKEVSSADYKQAKKATIIDSILNFFNRPTNVDTTSITVNKEWRRVDSSKSYTATFVVKQNGVVYGKSQTITGNASTTFANLPKFDENNKEYTYTVEEKTLDGFTATMEKVGDTTYKFINRPTNTEKVTLVANKQWTKVTDADAYTATIDLYKNGKVTDTKTIKGNGKVEFSNLEKFDENNNIIVYSLAERNVEGFINHPATVKGNEYTFVNEKVYENPKQGELKTTVSVAGETGTQEKPATLIPQVAETVTTVTDTIKYTDLVPNEKYTVTGTLYTVENGVQKESVATATQVFTADKSGNGQWQITFDVKGLKENTKYVVFEKAVSVNPHFDNDKNNEPETPQVVTHENPKDNSQTVAVKPKYENPNDKPKLSTTVKAGEIVANEQTPATITPQQAKSVVVVDTIRYENLVPNKEFTVTGNLYKVVNGEKVGEPIATKTEKKVSNGVGTGEWTLTFDATSLEENTNYVVFEKAISTENLVDSDKDNTPDKPQTGVHEDPKDNSQTVVVTPKYPNPKEKEELKTTVNVAGVTATEQTPATVTPQQATNVAVQDTIAYSGMVAGEKYSVTGKLYKVVNGETVGEPVAIKTEEKVAATGGVGVWTITFDVTTLEENTNYVVFEKAVSLRALVDTDNDNVPDKPQTGVHENPKDPSQSATVTPKYPNPSEPTLKTTVRSGEKVANENTPATLTSEEAQDATTVVDTIAYSNLVPNEDYNVTGRLYKVSDAEKIAEAMKGTDKTSVEVANELGITPIATKEATLNSGTGSGNWEIEFDVTNKLEVGAGYVAFERAVSVKPLVDTDNNNTPDKPQTGVHEDPKDHSQSVVTEKPQTVSLKAQKVWKQSNGDAVVDASAYTVDVELYRNDVKIDTKTISGNGEVEFANLPKKDANRVEYKYTLKETNASVLSTLVSQVNENGVTVFTNKVTTTSIPPTPPVIDKPELQLGFLDFSKVDISTRAAVEGATMEFYKEGETSPFLTGVTNAEGKILPETAQGETSLVQPNGNIVLEVGKYFFKETKAPEGYVLNDAEQHFVITKDQVTKATFENKKETGFARIIKKDADSMEYIAGAVFDIYKKGDDGMPSGALLKQVTVEAGGSDLELVPGAYVAVEVSAPAGYVLPEQVLDRQRVFEVTKSNIKDSPIEIEIFNSKPSIPVEQTTSPMLYLSKVDETGRPLAGATISIFRAGDSEPIITGVTNDNGRLEVATSIGTMALSIQEDGRIKLENGEYVVRETGAPSGYVLDTQDKLVSLSEQNMVAMVTIVNQKEKPQPISLTVRKSWTNIQEGKTAADYRATIQLLQNGLVIDAKEIVGDSEIVFDNLAKLDADGNEYNYEVKEVESEGYSLIANTREGDVVTLVNEVVTPPTPNEPSTPPTPPTTPNEPNTPPTPPTVPSIPNEPNTPPTPPTVPSIPNEPNTPPTPPTVPSIPNEPNTPPTVPEEPIVIEGEEPTPLAPPTEEIIDEDVPKSAPPLEEIEEDVPLGLPKTGSEDTTAAGILLLALGMMVIARKRNQK